jgi:P-type Cu+ transporter
VTTVAPGPGAATQPGEASTELLIGGMTCASCAARIEKKLNRLDGVSASVNYATEKARITHAPAVTAEDLVAVIVATGYTARPVPPPAAVIAGLPASPGTPAEAAPETDAAEQWRRRLVGCVVLTVPVIVLAMVPGAQFRFWQWASLTFAAPVVVWGAWPFHHEAWANLRRGTATMDTLISLGVIAAFGWSLWALFRGGAGEPGHTMHVALIPAHGSATAEIYLEVAAGLPTFILAGRYFEARARRRSGEALRALLALGAKDVAVLRDGREERIAIDALTVGDEFVVRPGEKIATDGSVTAGASAIDAAMLTGEPVPVDVSVGDTVTGGTMNTTGRLQVRATRVGADTALAQIARLVDDAQNRKAAVQRLADRVSAVFVPIVVALAVATLGFWLGAGTPTQSALTAAVAVLIIACPCSLGLATPIALMVGTGRGAQIGILIKGPEVLESTRRVDTVVLDKTGTITTGRMELVDVLAAPGQDAEVVLSLAGAVEDGSEHPLGRAIAAAAKTRAGGVLPGAREFSSEGGLGVRGTVDGRDLRVGRRQWVLAGWDQAPAPELEEAASAAEAVGQTAVWVGWDNTARGLLVLADTIKPTSPAAVAELKSMGLHTVLLTGDNARAARAVAAAVGIEDVIAEVLPQEKAAAVRDLQARGRTVAMVGDGVNDAAALAQADLGLAMGGGTDAAIQAADLTLVRGDPTAIADAIRLSRRTLATIKGNLAWAFAYNLAALPLAAAGLLNPMIAGAAMAASSVFVVSNSLRLRRFRPAGQGHVD